MHALFKVWTSIHVYMCTYIEILWHIHTYKYTIIYIYIKMLTFFYTGTCFRVPMFTYIHFFDFTVLAEDHVDRHTDFRESEALESHWWKCLLMVLNQFKHSWETNKNDGSGFIWLKVSTWWYRNIDFLQFYSMMLQKILTQRVSRYVKGLDITMP